MEVKKPKRKPEQDTKKKNTKKTEKKRNTEKKTKSSSNKLKSKSTKEKKVKRSRSNDTDTSGTTNKSEKRHKSSHKTPSREDLCVSSGSVEIVSKKIDDTRDLQTPVPEKTVLETNASEGVVFETEEDVKIDTGVMSEKRGESERKLKGLEKRSESESESDEVEEKEKEMILEGETEEEKRKREMETIIQKLKSPLNFMRPLSSDRCEVLLKAMQYGTEPMQLEAVVQLNDALTLSPEDSLSGFPTKQFVVILGNLLNLSNFEINLGASRSMLNLLEVLPAASQFFVKAGVLPSLCLKLTSSQVVEMGIIDVAELAMHILSKISQSQPVPCLQAGALKSAFTFFCFYQDPTARHAVTLAANICSRLPSDSFDHVLPILETLTQVIDYDKKMIEDALLCFSRITECFFTSEEKLDIICSYGLIPRLTKVVSSLGSNSNISATAFSLALRIMVVLCRSSVTLLKNLLDQGLCRILSGILEDISKESDRAIKSTQQVSDTLAMINELLPPLPQEIANFIPNTPDFSSAASPLTVLPFGVRATFGQRISNLGRPPTPENKSNNDPRCVLFETDPKTLIMIGENLFPNLLKVFNRVVNTTIRYKAISSITKIIHYSNNNSLKQLLKGLPYSSFIARLLADKELGLVSIAVYLAELSMEKLPEIFRECFLREGVVHELEKLISSVMQSPIKLPRATFPKNMQLEQAHLGVPPLSGPSEARKFQIPTPPVQTPVVHKTSFSYPIDTTTSLTTTPLEISSEKHQNFKREEKKTKSRSPPRKEKTTKSTSPPRKEKYHSEKQNPHSEKQNPEKSPGGPPLLNTVPPEQPPSPKPQKSRDETLREWIHKHVLLFRDKYFTSQGGFSTKSEEFNILVSLSEQLKQIVLYHENSKDHLVSTETCLKEIANLLFLGISDFEYANSGCTSSILICLTHNSASSESYKLRKKRICLFASTFMVNKRVAKSSHTKSPLNNLVRFLLQTMNADLDDIFPVLMNGVTPGSALKILMQPFKCNLIRDPKEKKMYPYEKNFVQVEPLATVANIEAFLQVRAVQPPSPAPAPPLQPPPFGFGQRNFGFLNHQAIEEKHKSLIPKAEENDNTLEKEEMDVEMQDYEENEKKSETPELFKEKPPTLNTKEEVKKENPILLNPNEQIALYMDGVRLDRKKTLFQVIQHHALTNNLLRTSSGGCSPSTILWDHTHNISYKIIEKESTSLETTGFTQSIQSTSPSCLFESPLDEILSKIPNFKNSYSETLSLIWILYHLNQLGREELCKGSKYMQGLQEEIALSPKSHFLSSKLSTKVARQLQDPLTQCSGVLPDWCQLVVQCPYLFSLETRLSYFRLTSFGITRALKMMGADNLSDLPLPRHKVRIDRNKIFQSAMRVIDHCIDNGPKLMLQVEYFGEPGVGLGPTKEFYTLVSKEVLRKKLDMWLPGEEEGESPYVYSRSGLFPKPIQFARNPEKVVKYFHFLGKFVAKALLDDRLLDIPFSEPFYKLFLGENLTLRDLVIVKPELVYVLEFRKICNKRRKILEDTQLDPEQKKEKLKSLLYRGKPIENMDLTFRSPGEGLLIENGDNISVTLDNLQQYVQLIMEVYLSKGIDPLFTAFKKGFNYFLPLERLRVFCASELDVVLCGTPSDLTNWTYQEIQESAKFGSGYTLSSKTVVYLINTLVSFTVDQRRCFLRFLTGSPRLPIGGLRSMQPKFTIQRKKNLDCPDNYLPSVNTCFLFLKLPEYSSEEITRQKLLQAMTNGYDTFDFH